MNGEAATWKRSYRRRGQTGKGAIKEAAGKALGDAKLAVDGKDDKVEGKTQNAIGGLKDVQKK
jgi:uncharacterized protein YjbJ (UPF0337 family)